MRFRFGIFEANAETGELRRQGTRIRLNSQPFQMLLLLLERPGELVTREEIARRLWPDGTFVDYDHGLNSAMNRIREALGDSAVSPRFVETLARRGYRFIAPVEVIDTGAAVAVAAVAPGDTDANGPSAHHTPATVQSECRTRALLASVEDLPMTSASLAGTLYFLLQAMYLAFYAGALTNLPEIDDLLAPVPHAHIVYLALVVTAVVLIPVRAFTLCAALFRPPHARAKLLRLWPFLFACDVLWALAPFLLLHHIDFGAALACMALLVYSPFAQRSLVLMGAGSRPQPTHNEA